MRATLLLSSYQRRELLTYANHLMNPELIYSVTLTAMYSRSKYDINRCNCNGLTFQMLSPNVDIIM